MCWPSNRLTLAIATTAMVSLLMLLAPPSRLIDYPLAVCRYLAEDRCAATMMLARMMRSDPLQILPCVQIVLVQSLPLSALLQVSVALVCGTLCPTGVDVCLKLRTALVVNCLDCQSLMFDCCDSDSPHHPHHRQNHRQLQASCGVDDESVLGLCGQRNR